MSYLSLETRRDGYSRWMIVLETRLMLDDKLFLDAGRSTFKCVLCWMINYFLMLDDQLGNTSHAG